jgi:preprotein translocase subunit SecG
MLILGYVVLGLFLVSAVLLVILVLMQNEQGDSLGGLFSGSSQTTFGSRSSNILIKITTALAVIFFVGSLGIAFLNRSSGAKTVEDSSLDYSAKNLAEAWSSAAPSAAADLGLLPAASASAEAK